MYAFTPIHTALQAKFASSAGRLRRGARYLLGSYLIALGSGCSDGKPVNLQEKATGYFPLRVGYSWTYEVTTDAGSDVKTRAIEGEEMLRGLKTFVQTVAEEQAATQAVANLYPYGGRIVSLREQRFDPASGDLIGSSEYDPGLVDFSEGLAAPDDALDDKHTRTDYDASGVSVATSKGSFTWLVEAADVDKEVLGETFTCLQVQRSDKMSGENHRLYFSQGIGKVLDETLDADGMVVRSEALKEYALGE